MLLPPLPPKHPRQTRAEYQKMIEQRLSKALFMGVIEIVVIIAGIAAFVLPIVL